LFVLIFLSLLSLAPNMRAQEKADNPPLSSVPGNIECPRIAPKEDRLVFTEVWRTDANSDEYLLGNIQSAVLDDEGSVYLLDIQQQMVFRFSATGEYLGVVARNGEGPGEIRGVWSIGWWPPDSVVLPQPFPPRVVRVSPTGTAQKELLVYTDKDDEMPASVTTFSPCGEFAVVGGRTFTFSAGQSMQRRWLGVVARDGSLRHMLAQRSTPASNNPLKQTFDELESFWPWDRWAASPTGRIFVAPVRDEYVIEVYDLDGERQARWTRPVEPRQRTEEDFEAIRSEHVFIFNDQKADVDFTLSDLEPPISALHCFGDELWVMLDQVGDEAAFARAAVHALDGRLIAEHVLEVPYDEKNDKVLLLDESHIVVIENGLGAQAAQFSGGEDADEALSDDPIEVVLYAAHP
jgi:hypothetical protein